MLLKKKRFVSILLTTYIFFSDSDREHSNEENSDKENSVKVNSEKENSDEENSNEAKFLIKKI